VSIDQEFGEKTAFAFHYGDNDGKRKEIERLAGAGVLIKHVLRFQVDEFGLGGFWAEPGDPSLRDEYGFEAFWRFQLTQRTQLTPDLQVWRPSRAASDNWHGVMSLRLAGSTCRQSTSGGRRP
jgi:hypothetical protein